MQLVSTIVAKYHSIVLYITRKIEDRVWNERTAKALQLFPEKERKSVEIELINQIKFMRADKIGQRQGTRRDKAQVANYDATVFNISVKSLQQLQVLKRIVGVQPLQGPVGLAYRLAYSAPADTGALCMSIVSDVVEARSRQLNTSWSMENTADLSQLHGIDVKTAVIDILGIELAQEKIAEVVNDLLTLANQHDSTSVTLDKNTASHALQIIVGINRASARIAHKTRRARGNFAIVSPDIAFLLKQHAYQIGFESNDIEPTSSSCLTEVGTFNKTMVVLVSNLVPVNQILVGFKSQAQELDTGYIYSPYVCAMPNRYIDERFEPRVQFITRYGKTTFDVRPNALVPSSSYYQLVTIDAEVAESDAPEIDAEIAS